MHTTKDLCRSCRRQTALPGPLRPLLCCLRPSACGGGQRQGTAECVLTTQQLQLTSRDPGDIVGVEDRTEHRVHAGHPVCLRRSSMHSAHGDSIIAHPQRARESSTSSWQRVLPMTTPFASSSLCTSAVLFFCGGVPARQCLSCFQVAAMLCQGSCMHARRHLRAQGCPPPCGSPQHRTGP